jgi:fatty acid desaturase
MEDYRAFGDAIDEVKRRTLAQVGAEDVAYVVRLDRFSRAMEILGRFLIHVSPEPISFVIGVLALWVHKQLQASEIGHSSLHGAYDHLPGAERFRSRSFRWDAPVDEESWREGHNVKHHGNTNIVGKDPDLLFGPVRVSDKTARLPHQRFQLALTLGLISPHFAFVMNAHFTGLYDALFDNGPEQRFVLLPDRSPATKRRAWKRALRKWVPYYIENYVLFPLLAGPLFWKVLLGNWLAETLRDLYLATTISCGHVGHDVAAFAAGTKARSRGHWYAMQVATTNNFEVNWILSVLCGGLDLQIEHHLFPTLPPRRLRQIAPEVRSICERYGLTYKSASWPRTLRKALAHIGELGRPTREGAYP